MKGNSISDHCLKRGTGKELLNIATKAANALKKIHACNVVHGDISEQNIIIDQTGKPIFIDFAHAKKISKQDVSEDVKDLISAFSRSCIELKKKKIIKNRPKWIKKLEKERVSSNTFLDADWLIKILKNPHYW